MRLEHIDTLCDELGIILDELTIENMPVDGLAWMEGNEKVIVINSALTGTDRMFVIAHEIGHHVLKHLTDRNISTEAEELEADVFAAVWTAMQLQTYGKVAVAV